MWFQCRCPLPAASDEPQKTTHVSTEVNTMQSEELNWTQCAAAAESFRMLENSRLGRGNGMGRGAIPAAHFLCRVRRYLEAVLQRALHGSRVVHGLVQSAEASCAPRRRLAERGRHEGRLRRVQVGVVRQVEDLPFELDLLALRDLEVLPEASVYADRTRTKEIGRA